MREEELNNKLDRIIKEEPVAMPAPAPTKPAPTKPAPTKPGPGPSRPDPFKPPKPHIAPKPKAEDMPDKIDEAVNNVVSEAYDEEINPSTKSFWENLPTDAEHTFAKHPVLAMHGDRLSRSAYEYLQDADHQTFMLWVQRVMRVEREHKQSLEELAKDLTVKIWGVPREMLHAELTTNVDIPEGGPLEQSTLPEMEAGDEPSEELRAQINKRITTNALTHGAAVHQMLSMHHVVDKELNDIDKKLVKAYSTISRGSVKMYWFLDIMAIADSLRGMRVGNSAVVFEQPESEPESEQQKGKDEFEVDDQTVPDSSADYTDAKVVAKATCFPVLCQELSKGVMEMLMMHGYAELAPEVQKALQKYSDVLEDEPWLIQIGPEMWRRLLKSIPKDVPLSSLMMQLGMADPETLHKVIDASIDDPEKATALLNSIAEPLKEVPEETESEYDTGADYEEKPDDTERYSSSEHDPDDIGYDPEDVEFNPDDFEI